MLRRASVAAVVLAVGCGSCEPESGTRVPFKRDDDGTGRAGEGSKQRDRRGKRFEPRPGQSFPDGTSRIAVEGAPLSIDEGSLRSLLAADFDEDGDRDAIVIRSREDGAADVAFARREGSSFGTLRSLAPLAEAREGCTIRKVAARIVSAHLATASLNRRCEQGAERALALVSLEATPRVHERVTLLPEHERTPGDVSVAMRTVDEDDDGYQDLVLDVTVTPTKLEPAEVKLVWLDRPGGLARDRDEPERTIAELASRARGHLESDPEAALQFARRALTVHGMLCRSEEGPRLRFGDTDGLACGPSRGAGEAAAVAAAALARDGRLFEALDAASRLRGSELDVGEQLPRLVDRAWADAPTPDGLRWREVASHRVPESPEVRLPAVAFVEPNRLLLRGEAPRTLDLASDELAPADEEATGVLVRDPSGAYAVVDVRRSCEGFVLTIVKTENVVAGVVAGRPVSQPLLEPRPPPAGARCPGSIGEELAEQDGDWHVLGWAPQGVVAVRDETMRVVPMTDAGQPAGEPTELGTGTPPPAPLPHGAATPDGQAYVVGTPYGVLLRRVGPPAETVLLRPDGWKDVEGDVGDVAIAPDQSRVALMRGKQVWVIEGLGSAR